MNIDPNSPIAILCLQGIQAEMGRDFATAKQLYEQAWSECTNDYDYCIAAHYMARVQTTPEDILHWNMQALRHAEKVADDSIKTFMPSLYLNIGRAYENMGDNAAALKHYHLAEEHADILPDNRLGDITRDAIARGKERTGK